MQYIGNKRSLVHHIHNIIKKYNMEGNILCDIFSGTHAVGSYFKKKEYSVISNDWQVYSYVIGKALIDNNEEPCFTKLLIHLKDKIEFKNIIDYSPYKKVLYYLNSLEGICGFVYNNYCPTGTVDKEYQRMYFSDENGKKFDAIRTIIEEWKEKQIINSKEFYILLATLIEDMDGVSNTTSVYGAFLKELKGQAIKKLILKPLELIINNQENKVYNEDANLLVKKIYADIFYLDPPYNARQYASNYHVLETMALYDNPILYGKTGLREYEDQKSPYSSKVKAKEALRDLILNIKGKYIILSYNNEGILSEDDIREVLSLRGEVYKEEIEYKRFKSDKNNENRQYKMEDNKVFELLYILKIER
jgi:adenine-specific DNA-methyltransferase